MEPCNQKRCGKCGEVKLISEFGINRSSKDGLLYCCKLCARRQCSNWRKAHPEIVKSRNKKYGTGRPRPKNATENNRRYNERHHFEILAKRKQRRIERRSDPLFRESERAENRRNYTRRSSRAEIKIQNALRARLVKILKLAKQKKVAPTLDLLGCPLDYFMKFIERQFKPGMTWANHGIFGWHLDHVKPCAAFDLTNPEEQRWCFHYSNLQPLWWNENISKGKKYGNS